MGKRSKKGAAAKAKAGTDGSVPTTVSTSSASSKQRCAGCCAFLKELAKAHQCPGCSQLFCWRCEKKYFEECPNGAACVRQVRRCDFCWNGTIFENSCGSLLFKTGDSQERAHHFYVTEAVKLFQEEVKKDDALTIDAFPPFFCLEEGCKESECHVCFSGPAVSRLIGCSICYKARCHSCSGAKRFQLPTVLTDTLHSVLVSRRDRLNQDELAAVGNALRAAWSDSYIICMCGEAQCYACLDDRAMDLISRDMLRVKDVSEPIPSWSEESAYKCSRCYWKSKPCTNPTCPNEVGVPTKRCGGCRLDRYCSVECQVAAHSGHIGKCTRIQHKRAAADKIS